MRLRLASIAIVFFSVFSLSSQERREWDIYTDWRDIREMFYEEMSLREQVELYCLYFDDPRYYDSIHPKLGYHGVFTYFINQEDEEAIPYFLHQLVTQELAVFDSPEETYDDSVTPINIIRLIDNRVRKGRNLDIDTALKFTSIAEVKILEYITRNRRIDINLRYLESYVQAIRNYAKGLHPVDWLPEGVLEMDSDSREARFDLLRRFFGELIYNKYVVGNGLEFLDVGIESPYVFWGYTGRVITPEDPGYLGVPPF